MRTSKTSPDGEVTYFTYDENHNLTLVQYGGHRLEYRWNVINRLLSITIDGVIYTCELDDTSVYRLYDAEGNIVVEYHYEDGFVDSVYGRNEAGELVDRTNDHDFIGNINKVTFNSYYFDEETGWYYCGRYYDPINGRIVDGISSSSAVQLLSEGTEEMSLREFASSLYNICMNDTDFGAPKAQTQNWYDGMHTPEILARLIYGENPYANIPSDERVGIAWVLWNRKMKQSYGGFMLRSIATATEQFSAICHGSENARMPVTSSIQWRSSVLYACYLYAAENGGFENPRAELLSVMPLPYGMGYDHTRFCSYDSAMTKLENGTTLRQGVIAGYDYIGSTAASLEATFLDCDEAFYEENGVHIIRYVNGERYECINIFYCD